MKRGLTLGKFAPFHRGHQRVVETALAEMDETLVLIYDAPEVTDVPLPVRSAWIRRLCPSARVIEAWDGPHEVGYTPEIMRAHEQYVIETLGIRGITHFYSGEPYGEHMSRALGAVDRRVEDARDGASVRGRDIRRDPFVCRAYVDPRVYRDLIVNVALVGAPSTGKTTLAERLAQELETEWMPEYGRTYWNEHQVDRRLTPKQLVAIAEGHLLREEALLARANRYLFTDTNAITTATFARYYHSEVDARLEVLADAAIARYDITFLCDTDIPYENTPDRSGEANRDAFQRQVVADLLRRKVPFITVRGPLDARVAQVHAVLARSRKYMNPLDLVRR